eukprot:scaffold5679_cov58-Cylindrotheca_fusiformis.AAC.2
MIQTCYRRSLGRYSQDEWKAISFGSMSVFRRALGKTTPQKMHGERLMFWKLGNGICVKALGGHRMGIRAYV